MILETIKANLLACILGLAAAVFLVIAVVQSIQIDGFLWWGGLKDKLEECGKAKDELQRISTEKNEQKAETGRNIDKAEKGERDAAPIVKIIREAPIGPNCTTPGIEILRNEI